MTSATAATPGIAGIHTATVIARPIRWPEWICTVSGAALLLIVSALRDSAGHPVSAAVVNGTVPAFACNLINDQPAGPVAATAVAQAQPPRIVTDILVTGV